MVESVSGQSSVPVQVFVAGQQSAVFTIPVQSPVIDAVDVYDTGLLVPWPLESAVYWRHD
jgi:hypothetical protein